MHLYITTLVWRILLIYYRHRHTVGIGQPEYDLPFGSVLGCEKVGSVHLYNIYILKKFQPLYCGTQNTHGNKAVKWQVSIAPGRNSCWNGNHHHTNTLI